MKKFPASFALALSLCLFTFNLLAKSPASQSISTPAANLNTPQPPSITVSGAASFIKAVYGSASASSVFYVNAANLSSGLLITTSPGLEISRDNVVFSNQIIISQAGVIADAPVYVRIASGTAAGAFSGAVFLSCQGSLAYMLDIKGSVDLSAADLKTANGNANPIMVFPNPFTGNVSLNLGNDNINDAVVRVYDAFSKVVFKQQYANVSGTLQLDLPNLTQGVYLVELIADGRKSTRKIFKK